jgi:hypothetical protein
MLNRDCREDEKEQWTRRSNFLPCAQTGVPSGVCMQEEVLIRLPVWPKRSNLLFNFFNTCTFRAAKPVHKIRHFALLSSWSHVTDWSTDYSSGATQCRSAVVKARNCTRRQIYNKKTGDTTFLKNFLIPLTSIYHVPPTFACVSCSSLQAQKVSVFYKSPWVLLSFFNYL